MRDVPDKLLQALQDAGWSEERTIDLADYERGLAVRGWTLPETVRQFLHQFGGLTLNLGALGDVMGTPDSVHIYPVVVDDEWAEELEDYSRPRIGKPVLPVGYRDFDNTWLLMDPDGAIYEYTWPYLWKLGQTALKAFETIMYNLKPIEHYHQDIIEQGAEGFEEDLRKHGLI